MTTYSRSKKVMDETIIAMQQQPDNEFLENLSYPPSRLTTGKAFAVSVHSRYCSKKLDTETTSEKMVVQYLELKSREKHFFCRGRHLEKPAFKRCCSQGQV